MAAVQSSHLESLEVRESGRALKVQTDNPHLVSIGSGRLSTNVTWHPLPEGKVILGTSSDVDIILQGTGVEPKHCIIENVSNVVTLYPIAEMTTVDGHQVTSPVRLCQGNMLCIGRSNYLRFNHPAEANLMKKFLPNTRISMAAPLNFFGNGNGFFEKKPPMPPSRKSQDSWEEFDNNGMDNQQCNSNTNKFSKFEYFSSGQNKNVNSISPKVFPPGSATVNSPAAVVLGHSRIPNGLFTSSEKNSKIASSISENECIDYIEPPIPQIISSFPQKVTVSSFNQQTYHNGIERSDNDSSKIHSTKVVTLPSPAFNRNPAPYISDRFRSNSPNVLPNHPISEVENCRSITPSPGINKFFKEPNGLMSRSCDARLSPDFFLEDYETRESREEQLELKMVQAQNERKLEQKAQLLEKQRLDEILSICAEYERQVQNERQTQIPTTPTLHQNRIKTNGSLPRDKRNNGLPSPLALNSDDELNQIFTFDNNKSPIKTINCVYDNVRVINNTLQVEPPESIKKSNENFSTSIDSPDRLDITSVVNRHVYVENTFAVNPEINEKVVPSQSPRIKIKTTFREPASKEAIDTSKQLPGFADYDTADPIKYREHSPNSQKRKFLTPSQQLNKFNNLNNLICANKKIDDDQKFILPVEEPKDLSDLMMILEKEFSATLSEFRNSDKSNTSSIEVQQEDSWMNDELNNDLPESERDMIRPKKEDDTLEVNKTENFLRKKSSENRGKMKVEKTAWLGVITRLKSEIQNLNQQEEEILREVKMELALLNAEHLSQIEKQKSDEDKLKSLKEKKKQLDIDIEQCKERDADIQKNCNDRIQDLKKELHEMEESLGEKKEFSEEYKNLVEKLEMEKKSFEDVEFKHLEEEANWLATKDELQREINDIEGRLEDRKTKLIELENQIKEIGMSSQKETHILEQQKINLLQQLDDAKTKMKELDVRLSAESAQDNFSEGEEGSGYLRKSKRSQEDLVRISKVTSDAPIDVGKTGSLGRKTLESLKEIERNRQIHLAKQGSQVIEEERKRVELLKRRVQDEVKAQWERIRQKECNSLNSVGSEDSNMTCSDQPTESASSEDVDKSIPKNLPISSRDSADSDEKMRKESDGSEFRNSRPISDCSGSEFEHQMNVKRRDQKPMRLLQQRPLTRYLPIKSESLNLRQHIESAGHQVDLCPHVSIDATSCRGLLHKLGSKFHHWNKRWFVFDRMRRTLSYYSDKTEKKQRGGTYFQAISEVYVDHLNSVKSPNPHVTFVIKTHERNYFLMAPSPEAMRIWVDVIFTGAEGYQEFEHGS